MSFQFTPAAERALHAATAWLEGRGEEITPTAVLLGLLEQTECRAANQLAERGIGAEILRQRDPQARRSEKPAPRTHCPARQLSPEVESAIHAAVLRLDENPRTCQVATEHILLGLALGENELGGWLRERGIDPVAMEAEICARYGIDRTPIPLDFDEPPISLPGDSGPDKPANSTLPSGAAAARSVLLRILDAEANRAGEALRVVEDHARFVLNDAELTRQCKELRHDLTSVLAVIPYAERLAARDTTGDVGTSISTAAETRRADLADVAAANLRRLQESLRSLEEYGKVLNPALAGACEQLRYRAYTLHKSFGLKGAGAGTRPRELLAAAKLYVLIDGRDTSEAFVALAQTLVEASVDILQLRDKQLDDRELLARARQLRALTAGTPALFIMNDRADLALLADADGVHVGQDELSVAEARAIVGPERLIGVSTHSIEQARQAVADGADYLGVGPTFPSGTKQFAAFPGLPFIQAVAGELHLPAFAIGGITAENIPQVRQAGVDRVAVSGAVLNASDVRATVLALRERLQ